MTPPQEDNPDEDSGFDDDAPSPEELAQLRRITPQVAADVDRLILARCDADWRPVAMVVGSSLDEFEAGFPGLPYVYLQMRILELADQGRLESRGDVMSMRGSELRLPERRGEPGAGR